MTTLTLSMIVKALDQASPTLGVVGRSLRGLFQQMRVFNVAWNRGLPRVGADVVAATKPAIAAFGAMHREAMGLLRTVSRIALGAGAAGYAFKRMFVDPAKDGERFQLMLEGVEQSPGRAESALHWIKEFKRRTGFELSEVKQAWVDFRREGLNPISGAFNRIADAAAANGQTFDRAAGIWREAMDGNVKGLDAWGITAEKVGDRIVLKYNHLGQTIQKTVKANDKAAIAQALGFIINEKWAGFAERNSRTLSALWSNLTDRFKDFAVTVMQGGAFDVIKDGLQELLDGAKQAAADGSLKRWAAEAGAGLKTLILFGRDAARFFVRELPPAIEWLRQAKDAIGGWRPVLIAVAALLGIGLAAAAFKFLVALGPVAMAVMHLASFIALTLIPVILKLGVAFLASPVGWIVLAIASIVAAAWFLYENWTEVWRFLDTDTGQAVQLLMAVLAPFWHVPMKIIRAWEPLKAAFAEIWASITSGFDGAVAWIEKKWEQLMSIVREARAAIDSVNPFSSGAPGGAGGGAAIGGIARPAPVLGSGAGSLIGRMPPATVDGEIRVVVSAEPGTDARITGARAGGDISLDAITGRAGRFI